LLKNFADRIYGKREVSLGVTRHKHSRVTHLGTEETVRKKVEREESQEAFRQELSLPPDIAEMERLEKAVQES
jgi:hypothetical protein